MSSEVDVGTTFRIYLPRVDAALDRDQPSILPLSLFLVLDEQNRLVAGPEGTGGDRCCYWEDARTA
jgi:hypothetical protein